MQNAILCPLFCIRVYISQKDNIIKKDREVYLEKSNLESCLYCFTTTKKKLEDPLELSQASVQCYLTVNSNRGTKKRLLLTIIYIVHIYNINH